MIFRLNERVCSRSEVEGEGKIPPGSRRSIGTRIETNMHDSRNRPTPEYIFVLTFWHERSIEIGRLHPNRVEYFRARTANHRPPNEKTKIRFPPIGRREYDGCGGDTVARSCGSSHVETCRGGKSKKSSRRKSEISLINFRGK